MTARGHLIRARSIAVGAGVATLLATGCSVGPKDPTIRQLERDKVVRKELRTLETGAEEAEPLPPYELTLNEAIQNYQDYIRTAPDGPSKQAAMRRLADLQLRATEEGTPTSADANVQDDWDKKGLERGPNDGRDSRDGPTSLYEGLLRQNPDAEDNDKILYQLARAYSYDNRPTKAIETLAKLSDQYPESDLANEADFRRAELLFLRQQFEPAEALYAKLTKAEPELKYHDYALYKRGWSLYKLSRYEDALDAFHPVLERKLPPGEVTSTEGWIEQLPKSEREIVEDSLRVMSLSLANWGDSVTINDYLAGRDKRRYEPLLYRSLADLYLEKERYSDAADTYAAYLQRNPQSELAPEFATKVIETHQTGGFPQLVLAAKQDYVERFAPGANWWQGRNPARYNDVVTAARQNTSDLALHYHAQSQDPNQIDQREENLNEAARWYRQWLAGYGAQQDAYKMRFGLAEVLFDAGPYDTARYSEAAEVYRQVAFDDPANEHSQAAAYAAVLSHQAVAAANPEGQRENAIRAAVQASEQLVDRYPNHAEANAVLTRATEDLYALSDRAEAKRLAERLLARQPAPNTTQQISAWTILGHVAFAEERWADAENGYGRALALQPGGGAGSDLNDNLATAIYKQGESARDAGNLTVAADTFLRVGQRVPSSNIRPTADYDAAAALIGAEQWQRAAIVLEGFRERYPSNELNQDVGRKLANAYLQSNQPLKAAGELMRIAADPSEDAAFREQAAFKAPELYEQAGRSNEANQAWEQAIMLFPTPLDRAQELRQRLYERYNAAGNNIAASRQLGEIMAAHDNAGRNATDRSSFLAANAALIQAKPALDAFRSVRLREPLQENLKKKKDYMEWALAAYNRAADYGVAEVTTEATFQIGDIYRQLSAEMLNSERPRGLDELALEEYEILLEEEAYPFEEQAIEIHEANIKRAEDGLTDEWIMASLRALGTMVPAKYGKLEQGEDVVEAR